MNHEQPRGLAVRDWIAEHWAVCGYGPTVREVQRHFGWQSPAGAVYHLRRLRDAGHIVWSVKKPRSIRPTEGNAT
jgi:SOS-response transcriptional repressor LexA